MTGTALVVALRTIPVKSWRIQGSSHSDKRPWTVIKIEQMDMDGWSPFASTNYSLGYNPQWLAGQIVYMTRFNKTIEHGRTYLVLLWQPCPWRRELAWRRRRVLTPWGTIVHSTILGRCGLPCFVCRLALRLLLHNFRRRFGLLV